VDWGKNHKFGIVECKYDSYTNTLYTHQRNYFSENELLAKLEPIEIANINNEGGIIIHTFRKLGIPKDAIIVCDSARPDNINLLRDYGWEYSIGIDKPKGSVMAGITLLQGTNVVYTDVSDGIDLEFKNYAYANDRLGVVDDEVIKAFDDCFTAETLITTINGNVKIVDIKKGDIVLTSNGYKKVLHKFNNGYKQIKDYSIQFDSFSLSLSSTENHLIKTDKGWTEISKLESGMMVYLINHSMEKNTNFIAEEGTLCNINTTCITKYGNFTKEKEKKDFTYTILMKIPGITKLKTLKKLRQKYIRQTMQNKDSKTILNGLKDFTKRESKKQKNGISQKKVLNNTKNKLLKQDLENKHLEKKNVLFAKKIMNQKRKLIINSVQTIAKANTEETQELIMFQENAKNAQTNLQQINIQKHKIVDVNSFNKRNELTYDLMVDEIHEFFANGLLVHNCIDPIRYVRRYIENN
jgi:hypothetical protein